MFLEPFKTDRGGGPGSSDHVGQCLHKQKTTFLSNVAIWSFRCIASDAVALALIYFVGCTILRTHDDVARQPFECCLAGGFLPVGGRDLSFQIRVNALHLGSGTTTTTGRTMHGMKI